MPGRASALSGSDFNPARIIDDGVFFNANTMNPGDIQNFLNAKVPVCDTNGTQPISSGSSQTRAQWAAATGKPAPPYTCLKNYIQTIPSVAADAYCNGIGGGTKSAADIIFNVAQACGINPQVLIVLLQKEQALVTDDWPWPVEYQSATGYGCPDTSACDAQYYGFFNQLYNAGHQYKRYIAQPLQFTYAVGRTSFIAYQANAPSCGGTNITIQTQATAALYNYTPYQPNQAALNNLYSSGDPCSAYGNRNFWRLFNDWFGSVYTDGFTLAIADNGNPTQYILFDGIKQAIPDTGVKIAWGLQNSSLVTMPASYLASITSGPTLDRLTSLSTSDQTVYFMDGGKHYRVTSQNLFNAWNFGTKPITRVPPSLFYLSQEGGYLTYSVKNASSPALYMVDGPNSSGQVVLRQYASPDVYHTWEGDADNYTTLSDDYFGQMDNAIGSPLTGYTIKTASDASQYQVVAGQKLYLSGAMAAVFNQPYQTISQLTLDRLVTSSPVTNFVRLSGTNATIYMVDNGQKYPISSVPILLAWSLSGNSPTTNITSQAYLNLLASGSALNTVEADVAGQLYLMDGKKIAVPANLDSAYRTGSVFSSSAALMNLYSQAANATDFVKGFGTPSVYLMDNASKRHITNSTAYQLWNGTRNEPLTIISDSTLNQLPTGGDIASNFVNNGSANYALDNGMYYSVTASVASDWGYGAPATIDPTTLSRFTNSNSTLSSKVRSGSAYYLVKYGKSHITFDTNLASIWGIDLSGPNLSQNFINTATSSDPLTIFVRSTDTTDTRIFVADSGAKLYPLNSVQQVQNYGYSSPANMLQFTPSDLGSYDTSVSAQNIMKNTTNYAVLDGGVKRSFDSTATKDKWVLTGDTNALNVSDALWNFIPNGSSIDSTIKGSVPNVYAISNGQKHWVESNQTYQSTYAPFQSVSDYLTFLLQTGTPIP